MTCNWCQGPWLHIRTKSNYSHVEIQISTYTLVICDVARDSFENPWCIWQNMPIVRFYDAWKSHLAKCGRESMTHHKTPQAHLKPIIYDKGN